MICSSLCLLVLMSIILRVDGLLGKMTGTAYGEQVSGTVFAHTREMKNGGRAISLPLRLSETGCTARFNANAQLASCARARLGAAAKSGASTDKKPHRISRTENISRGENNQKKTGVAKPKRGYRRGYKFTFDFVKPNSHAGCRLSLERFHSLDSLKACKERFFKAFLLINQ